MKIKTLDITFDKAKLVKLKAAYQQAVNAKAETFWFEDRKVLVTFAAYLIEYLEKYLYEEPKK